MTPQNHNHSQYLSFLEPIRTASAHHENLASYTVTEAPIVLEPMWSVDSQELSKSGKNKVSDK